MKNSTELKTTSIYPIVTSIGLSYLSLPFSVIEGFNFFEETIAIDEGRTITVTKTVDSVIYLN